MASLLFDFEIASNLSEIVKTNISNFFVFKNKESVMYFITSDDKVYGLGSNENGLIDNVTKTYIDIPHLIEQLCEKIYLSILSW